MTIFLIGDDYADGNMSLLRRHLELLDIELTRISSAIGKSKDPESEGLCDWGEYFVGHGFIAIQQYIASTYPQFKMEKSKALELPPMAKNGPTVVKALNAGANYWKHMEEWGLRDPKIIIQRDVDRLENSVVARCISTIV